MNIIDYFFGPIFHPKKMKLWNELDDRTCNLGNQTRYATLIEFPLKELKGEIFETKLNVIRVGYRLNLSIDTYCFMAGGSDKRTPKDFFYSSLENSLKNVSKNYLKNKPDIMERVDFLVRNNLKPSEDYLDWTYKKS